MPPLAYCTCTAAFSAVICCPSDVPHHQTAPGRSPAFTSKSVPIVIGGFCVQPGYGLVAQTKLQQLLGAGHEEIPIGVEERRDNREIVAVPVLRPCADGWTSDPRWSTQLNFACSPILVSRVCMSTGEAVESHPAKTLRSSICCLETAASSSARFGAQYPRRACRVSFSPELSDTFRA
jgi:hypothetical protein